MELPLSYFKGLPITGAELAALDADLRPFWGMSLEEVQMVNERVCELTVFDDDYWARRNLKWKNFVPFEM